MSCVSSRGNLTVVNVVKHKTPIESLEARRLLSATAFDTRVDVTVGGTPLAVATADFNRDGKADLAVADVADDEIKILFGNGDGTFATGPVLTLAAAPTDVIVGDVNGDGLPDVVAATATANSGSTNDGSLGNGSADVVAFLNTGNGAFSAGVTTAIAIASAGNVVHLAGADFNADGKLDLAYTDYNAGTAGVLLGTGTGTFSSAASFPAGTAPASVAIGDFNDDGKLDVAVATTVTGGTINQPTGGNSNASLPHGAIEFFQGDGAGGFTDAATYGLATTGASSLAVGDFNNDGAEDLVVGSYDASVSELLNTGNFTFGQGPLTTIPSVPEALAVADFNFDGASDFAATALIANVVSEYDGLGSATVAATVTTATIATSSQPAGIAVGDFNGDGKPDLVTANEGSGTLSVLLNDTPGTALRGASVAITADTNPAAAGAVVTLTATVTDAVSGANDAAAVVAPTGTITFYDGTVALGAATLAASTATGTATAALPVSTLAVGTHAITAVYSGNAAFATATSAALSQTITATASSGPNLVGSVASDGLPSVVVPGEKATIRVTISNTGDEAAAGVIADAAYLSLDGVLDPSDAPLSLGGGLARHAIRLKAGASITLAGTVTVPSDLPAGAYTLLVDVDSGGTISETDDADNVSSGAAVTASDSFGDVGGKANLPLLLDDSDGHAVRYTLRGPGTGTVLLGDDGASVSLTGTTAGSVVMIASASSSAATVHAIAATNTLGTLVTSRVSIVGGGINLAGGVKRLNLGDVSGGTLSLYGGPATTLSLGNVSGTTLADTGALAGVTVESWTGTAADELSASSIGTLVSRGDFDAAVILDGTGTALRSANVAGEVGGDWAVAGGVGSVRTASASGWQLTAGGSIASVIVNGVFADSAVVAGDDPRAGVYGPATLARVQVGGAVTSGTFAAGVSPGLAGLLDADGTLAAGDVLVSGGSIRSATVGSLDGASRIVAESLPAKVRIGGSAVTPDGDLRFLV